jgi:phosphonopyruvate decarboxylase
MIYAENLISFFKKNKIDFFTGVPDSILKKFSINLENLEKKKHVIATNEGSAVSMGIGYFLSTKKIACVYLQNSGLSNALNPLISIADKKVYSIPVLLLIGWRGAPNQKDEPQHLVKGKITSKLLKLLNIKTLTLNNEKDFAKLRKNIQFAKKNNVTIACLIKNGTFRTKKKLILKEINSVTRANFLEEFVKLLKKNSKIISTTGFTSRELFQMRLKKHKGRDFYMVGGMGHSSSVAASYALHSKKKIFCLDGDGSMLMHLGTLRTAGHLNSSNFKHIILNNNAHESVGGQTTMASGIDFKKLSISLGYKHFFNIKKNNQIKSILKRFISSKGPSLLEVKIKKKALKNLPRPKNLHQLKKEFMY